ncbi:hypothetical protein LMG28138_04182 [Pararobbsia alpina]|uniref:Uncharacterized protein n=1 Tax=Pararobbsia alpina TaxID=621374 RepID=A0A6S7BN94_9BURK|nr:hypothetical protein LMG28138_04182 [Pararobbsia alpina]
MTLKLHAHRFSSYSQKVLVAHVIAYRQRLLASPSFACAVTKRVRQKTS